MQWDKEAVEEFVKMPLADVMKETGKVFSEKLARKNNSERVTLREIDVMKKVYYDRVPEEVRNEELDKRIAEGETDLRERMEKSARAILKREIDLFTVDICHAKYFRCISQNIEVRELKKELEQKLRALQVSQMIADMLRDDERILAHHKITVSVSGCVNGCTGPETSPFGVSGVAKPCVTDADCSGCFVCVDRCRRNALVIRNQRPEIDEAQCDRCGNCIKFCPNGVFASEESGYRIFVGGKFGRFHRDGYELFKIADKETLMETLEATIALIREESIGEESLTSIINRVGVSPIFQKLYQGKENTGKKITMDITGMSCDTCVQRVAKALQAVPGVADVQVDLGSGTAAVKYDPALTSLVTMEQAVQEAGYHSAKKKEPSRTTGRTGECC
jgi:copper chaperone CopZ/Pyruvate/2-oxoacid:ferredoxin oxidoreductase delta subunit